MKFNCEEAPVAHYMVALVRQLSNHNQPLPKPEYKSFHEFMCYWVAFNNIYTKIADSDNKRPTLNRNSNGTVKTKTIANATIAKVEPVPEREQIKCALNKFSEDLKDQLIKHESTCFFLNRTPKMVDKIDGFGQILNGVINVGHTVDPKYPVWRPIDKRAHAQYMENNQDNNAKNQLAKQILCVLYTIRNNVFHAGKRGDDATDLKVVEKAVPLLSMIVLHFLDEE